MMITSAAMNSSVIGLLPGGSGHSGVTAEAIAVGSRQIDEP